MAGTVQRKPISYRSALLAVLVGIVHAGLAPVLIVAGVKPNLVLVAVVLVTAFFGFLPGVIWAFVAGLTANLLTPEPLGSLPLAMLLVAALVAGGERLLGRIGLLYPVLATLAGSAFADLTSLLVFALVGEPIRADLPIDLILGAAVFNAALVAALAYPVRALARRQAAGGRPAW